MANQLDIPCYYKELVAVAAQESGLAQEFISGINSDENAVMRELYLTADPVKRAVEAQKKSHSADCGYSQGRLLQERFREGMGRSPWL